MRGKKKVTDNTFIDRDRDRDPINPEGSQSLTADDILDSCGPPLLLEVPELPRNGKPGIVYIRRPSFDAMNSFWASRDRERDKEVEVEVGAERSDEDEVEVVEGSNGKLRNRGGEMSALMRFLIVQEDGITPLFTDKQVSRIKEARFDVFTRLQEGVNSVIRPVMSSATGDSPNPFEEKEETN